MQVKYTSLQRNDRATLDRYQGFRIAEAPPVVTQPTANLAGKVQEMQDIAEFARNLRPRKKNIL